MSWMHYGISVIVSFLAGFLIKHYLGEMPEQAAISTRGLLIDRDFKLRIFGPLNKQVTLFSGSLGMKGDISSFHECNSRNNDDDEECLADNETQTIRVKFERVRNGYCYEVHRSSKAEVEDCFDLTQAKWYGGFQHRDQPWPLEQSEIELTPYVSGDIFTHLKEIGGLTERYFISSNGIGIHIDGDVPLYVSQKRGSLCLVAKIKAYPYIYHTNDKAELNYTICNGWDIRNVHDIMSKKFIPRPLDIPDERMFRYPVWSTWAQYNKDINESAVLEFSHKIIENGFQHSQIEIDDDWTPFYGDNDFSRVKFTDPAKLIKDLNNLGFRVTVWVHPFMDSDSEAFRISEEKKYAVRTKDGKSSALLKWWNGDKAAMLDVTNPEAVEWFIDNLIKLRTNYNVSSFKFDAGESLFYPESYSINRPQMNPDNYARLWTDLAYRSDKHIRHQEVRVGWSSQKYPIFVRLFDRMSSWGYDTGLKTVIPAVLTFGILGYPFVLPDMIGGNAYSDSVTFAGGAYPERELFIRWLQMNTLLPSVQFSIAPWIYDKEVVNIAKEQMAIREKYADKIIDLAKQSVQTGHPIIRPLWWIDPNDSTAQSLDSEFLLGDDILVAPVLDKGANSRDIYIPTGSWVDQLRGEVIVGPKWLTKYPASLSELPHFEKTF